MPLVGLERFTLTQKILESSYGNMKKCPVLCYMSALSGIYVSVVALYMVDVLTATGSCRREPIWPHDEVG